MDEKKGIINIFVSIFFKIILTVGAIVVRRLLIQYIGNEANGLNSLYLSVLGFLSVAELGVGEAITFCMYKPIVEGDTKRVAALYNLFKKLYYIIGAVIFAAGIVLMFFLPEIARDYSEIHINIYRTYFLTLLSVVLTYAYSAKMSLLNAYKYNYISTTITSCGSILECVMKVLVILFTRSFEAYLFCRIVSVLFQWRIVSRIVKSKFEDIIETKADLDEVYRKRLIENIKAMFMHKIGNILVNTIDSLIISAFIGVVLLGKYSNYTSIMTAMISVLSLFFYPLTSVVGHAFVNLSKEEMKRYFYFFYCFNYIIGVVFCLGYYAVIDNLIYVLYGANLEISEETVLVITINYFIQFLRTSTIMFRTSTGVFYYDRWKSLFEGVANVILSVIFVQLMGIVGVILATIITNLLVCDTIEPYVVFKYGLGKRGIHFYFMNYAYIIMFVLCLMWLRKIVVHCSSVGLDILVNGIIAVGVAVIPIIVVVVTNKDFRDLTGVYMHKVLKKHYTK